MLAFSTAALSYTHKCKNDDGKYTYSDKPCSIKNNEMLAETIAINGQRKLTTEQLRVINEHYQEEQRQRALEAAKLLAIDQDRLRKIELEKLRSREKRELPFPGQ